MQKPFRYPKTSPAVIRLAVMVNIRVLSPLRQVEDLLDKRGIDIRHETARTRRNLFGPKTSISRRRDRRASDGKIQNCKVASDFRLDPVFNPYPLQPRTSS
jgi:transposase-like protein